MPLIDKTAIKKCELLGGFIEGDDCITHTKKLHYLGLTCDELEGTTIDAEPCSFPKETLFKLDGTVYERAGRREKRLAEMREYSKKWRASMSPGKKGERYASMSSEKKEQLREYGKERYASMSPEKKERYLAERREYTLQHRAERKVKDALHYASMSPGGKEQRLAEMREYSKKWYASLKQRR